MALRNAHKGATKPAVALRGDHVPKAVSGDRGHVGLVPLLLLSPKPVHFSRPFMHLERQNKSELPPPLLFAQLQLVKKSR